MDIDSLAAEFGSAKGKKQSTTSSDGVDIHALASEFGSKKVEAPKGQTNLPKVIIDTTPKPPISGVSDEDSAALNTRKSAPITPNDNATDQVSRDFKNWTTKLPGKIGNDTLENLSGARDLLTSATNDASKGGLGGYGKGIAKTAGAALMAVTSPVNAVVDNLVTKPVTEMTGNPEIGDRAGVVASSAIPVAPGTGLLIGKPTSSLAKIAVQAVPKNKAFSRLVDNIGPDNAGTVAKRMRENERLTPADLSPSVKADTQGLFTTPGQHINYLSDTAAQRSNTAKQAVDAAANQNLGHTVNVLDKLDALKASAQKVGREQINPAIVGAKPVDVSPVIAKIDAQLKPGISSVISSGQMPDIGAKKQLAELKKILTDGKSQRISAEELHSFQSVLRAKAEDLISSANGSERQLGHSLMTVRNGIVDSIDAAAGGKYKPALKNYRDEMHISEAFHHGHDSIITNGRKIEARPEMFEKWVKDATPAEVDAAREGARLAIDTQIHGFQHGARRGTDIGEVDFNKRKIAALFGKEEADKLFTKLKDERAIADTNSKLVQGSQTEMRRGSAEKSKLPEPSEVGKGALTAAAMEGANFMAGGVPTTGLALFTALKAGHKVKDIVKVASKKRENEQFAKFALPSTGPDREELIKGLEAVAAKSNPKLSPSSLARLVAP